MARVVYLLLLFLHFSVCLNAQKGDILTGGSFGFNVRKVEEYKFGYRDIPLTEDKTIEWSFSPEVGIWLSNQSQLGLAIMLSGRKINEETQRLILAPRVYIRRWYKLLDDLSVFGSLSVSYNYDNYGAVDFVFGNVIGNRYTNSVQSALSVGIGYSLTDNIDILGKLGLVSYTYSWIKYYNHRYKSATNESLDFNLNSGSPVFDIGIFYTFKRAG